MAMLDSDGTYRVKVTSKEFCLSSKGNEQLAIGYEVTGECPQKGQAITDFLSFSDAALPYTEKKMRTLGWTGIDLTDISTLGSVEAEIVVQSEEYEGKSRRKVKFVNALGSNGANLQPMDDGAKKAFAAKMRAKLAGLNAAQAKLASKKPQPAKSQQEPPPPDDADCPF